MTDSNVRLPMDPLGKPLMAYDFDFDAVRVAMYKDDGAGGIELWDGLIDVSLSGDLYLAVDDLEQYVKDQLTQYKFSGWTISGDDIYVGYEDKDGNYYVKYINAATGVVTFATGTGGIVAPGSYSGLSFGSFASKF